MAKPSLNYYEALHVGKVKTDVIQFTSIQSAITAITDNAAGKRYAVYVHPGTYTEKITMKPYVDLIGIGGQAETVIAFTATANDEPTVTGENSLIKGFVISSTGGALRARCVQAATAGFVVEDCALQVVTTGAAAIVLNATASCTITDCDVDIAGTAATAALFTTGGMTYTVNDSIFGGAATTDAIQVTTTPTLNLTGCTVSNNFNQDGGTVVVVRSQMEALAFGTAICTFTAELSRFTAGVTTADNFAHVITCAKCSFNGQNFNNAATGATTITLRDCDGIATLTNAGVGGTVALYECGVETLTTSQGTVTAYGGRIGACGGSTGTRFIWWKDANFLEVLPTMRIADALALAASGDVVHISKGTFAESNLAAVNGVDIVGEGWGLSIIATASANPIIAVGDNITCELHGLTIRNTGAGGAIHIETVGSGADLTLEDCRVTNSGAGDAVVASIGGAGLILLTARRCNLDGNAANSIVVLTQTAGGGLLYFNSWDCQFGLCGGVANAAIEASAANVADVNVTRAVFTTDCGSALYCANANHTVDIEDSEFNNAVVGIANPSAVNLTKCNNIGIFSHAAACTVTLRDCYLSNTYTIGAVAGVVNAYRTQFSTFTNGGSGAIAFEECNGTNINNNANSVMSIEGGHWDTVLQGVAAGTINIYEAIIATELDCSAGGQITAWNCNIADIDANGGGVTVMGGHIGNIADVTGTVVWWITQKTLRVISSAVNMKISDALAAAGANNVIQIYPGTYAESNLTLKAGVDLVGTDPDQCLIVVNAANPILNAGVTCSISNLTIGNGNAAGTAITITANTLTVRNCYLYGGAGDAIAMTAGTLIAYDTRVGAGDIDLSTAPCTLTMYRCQITTDPIDTAATAFAHVMTFEQCDFGGQNIASLATAGTTLALRGCTNVNAVSNAGTGAFTIRDSEVGQVTTTAAGGINIIGGRIGSCGGVVGAIVWRPDSANTWRVLPNMKIMDAADAAAAGDTILIGPGTFTEALDLDAAVNACTYKGFGVDKTIITQANATVVKVNNRTGVVLEDLTIQLTAGDNDSALEVAATTAAAGVILRNAVISAAWAANTVYGVYAHDGGGFVATVAGYGCIISATGGAISYAVAANTCTTAASSINLYGCILNGTTYDIYNDRITIETHKCELNGGGWWIQNNATAIGLAYNNEPMADPTPVVFAGAAGVFADLSGCELWTVAGVGQAVYEWVYVSANDTVTEADADGASTYPSIGVIAYKPSDTTAYVKKHGYLYKPGGGWTAGKIEYLSTTAGAETETRPSNAVVQKLGVAKNATTMLVNVDVVENPTKWLLIPIAWGAGSAPTGTHTDGNSRRAVAIAAAAQTVFSQAVDIPEDFLTFSKLYARLFPTVPTLTAMVGAHAYDDGIGYTLETAAANDVVANDMNLFPAASALVPVVNDAYYFGAARRFSQLDINIGTSGVEGGGAWTLAWEYSKGGGVWGALTGVVDGSVKFTAAPGVRTVSFVVPTDWATDTVNAVLAYYIRARIATVTTPIGTRPLGTQSWTNDGTYDWTAFSSAASDDEDEATHSDTDTANDVPTTEDLIEDLDISGAANAYTMVEKDCFSVELIVNVLTNTTQINVLGFRLEYIAQYGS